jgi:N-acetyl-alpha-D-glucosaminyl L-malate synthase BshA
MVSHSAAGGSGVVAHDLAGLFANSGHATALLTPSPRAARLESSVRHVFVDAPDYAALSGPAYGTAMAGAIIEHVEAGADLVHVHYALPWLTSAVLARALCRRPFRLIVTLHGTDVVGIGQHASYRATIAAALAQADAVITPSFSLRERAIDAFGDVARAAHVIPNFVDADHYTPLDANARRARRIALGAPELADAFWVAHISNFRDIKRTSLIAPMLGELAANRDVVLLLVGSGAGLNACASAARAVLGESRVVCTGTLETSAPALAVADAMLLPSEYESFGLAALEAMASAVPVVASNVGGLRELIVPECGFLCENNGIAPYVDALRALAADPDMARLMGQAGRARAIATYAPKSALRAHAALYGVTIREES